MSALKLRVRVGDTVLVVAGQDRGRVGRVVRVDVQRRRVAVDGVALVKRHAPGSMGQQGSLIYKERMLDVSNVCLWNQVEGRRVKVRFEVDGNGRKVRVDKVSGIVVD